MINNNIYIAKKFDTDLLRKISKVLTDTGWSWWLDQGSLLGLIRDGAPIPWDTDIDISVRVDSKLGKNQVRTVVNAFKAEGMYVYFDEIANAFKLKCFDGAEQTKWSVDIALNTQQGDTLYKTWPVYPKQGFRRSVFLAVYKLYTIAQGAPSYPQRTAASLLFVYFLTFVSYVFKIEILRRGLVRMIIRLSDGYILVKSPVEYFESIVSHNYKHISLPVPLRNEEYLAHKYGPTWRVPKKDWDYAREDGGVQPVQ